jgi:4,5-DOPA dioxygenase extradiol
MKIKGSDNYSSTDSAAKMPVLFVGHGSPMNAIEENEFTAGFREITMAIPKPVAILCISAHWETRGTYLTAMENPPTIHDFGGFPRKLYEVKYPAPGDPGLAAEIKALSGSTEIGLNCTWGLDHGAWSVIKHMYPEAGVPVIQMSLDYMQAPSRHYEIMKELAVLREKGVLVIGSGNMVHNLGLVAWDRLGAEEYGYDWAMEAGEKMKQYIIEGDHKQLVNYRCHGKAFELSYQLPNIICPCFTYWRSEPKMTMSSSSMIRRLAAQ